MATIETPGRPLVYIRTASMSGVGTLELQDLPQQQVSAEGCPTGKNLSVVQVQMGVDTGSAAPNTGMAYGCFWSPGRTRSITSPVIHLMRRGTLDVMPYEWCEAIDAQHTHGCISAVPWWSVIESNGWITGYAQALPGVAWTLDILITAVELPCCSSCAHGGECESDCS